MKSTPRVSAPVLAFGIIALTLSAVVGWYGYHKRQQPPAATPAAQTETSSQPQSATAPESENPPAEPTVPRSFEGGIPTVIPVSLAGLLVEPENGIWANDKPWINFPHGNQAFCGVEFNIEGVIQLESPGSIQGKRSYRKKVVVPLTVTNLSESGASVVELGTNVGCIHLLSATRYSGDAVPGTKIADVIWRYNDGQVRQTPVAYAVHVRDWRRTRYEEPAHLPHPGAKVVWRADERSGSDRNLRLYRFALANPEPGRIVKQVELLSAMANPSLFFIALSLDPLLLGERPDDSPDLEEIDPAPARTLETIVQDSTGQPIQGARVRVLYEQKLDGTTSRINKSISTDANGVCLFKFPVANIDKLDLSAWQDDSEHAGRKISWDTRTGEVIPERYTFKLGQGLTIGGVVVDESNHPIPDAKLDFYRFWSGNDEMNQKGEQPDLPSRTQTSDSLGQWQMKGLPTELLDRIGFGVKHPDFIGTNYTVGGNESIEQQLRAGTFKVILRGGLIVRGRVTDESDNPIADATVWAGSRYTRERQDKKTDAKGEFRFSNIGQGDVQFSVTAKSRKPGVKTFPVKPDMAEIVFKLGPGNLIRALVQNEAGEPLPGTRVSLESRQGGVAESYEFSATTDKEGRFEWDGAPDEPVQFYFAKEGYEQKRGQRLKQNEDNTVTMRKARKVQGWVVDAETEKPVTKFRIGVGRKTGFDTDRFFADSPGTKEYSDPNGTFTMELNEEQNNAIKAEADDYAEKVESLPAAENGIVQIVLRLKPSAALRGILVNSEGAPVAGATVALTKDNAMSGMSLRLRKGRLETYDRTSKIVTTDASGNFTLPSPPETGGVVVAAAASGFASAPADQVRNSGRLVLQGFGRIEGTIKISGTPTAGQEFMFSLQNIGVSPDWESYRTTSDEQGRFSFEKIPAGEGSVVRLIKMNNNSWRHSHNTSVVVEAGKATQVNFGDDGAVIKGQVRLETPPADGEKLTYDGSLNTKRPALPQNFSTPEEAQAFYRSPEWKEQMKQMKNYGVTINADGSLSLDSIPPGEYTLTVSANKPGSEPWQREPVATGSTTITVPTSASPYAPIAIGDLILKPVKKP